jgi:hypothetical protein
MNNWSGVVSTSNARSAQLTHGHAPPSSALVGGVGCASSYTTDDCPRYLHPCDHDCRPTGCNPYRGYWVLAMMLCWMLGVVLASIWRVRHLPSIWRQLDLAYGWQSALATAVFFCHCIYPTVPRRCPIYSYVDRDRYDASPTIAHLVITDGVGIRKLVRAYSWVSGYYRLRLIGSWRSNANSSN